jgi:hypothetical protein
MKQNYTYKKTSIKIKKQVVFALMLFLAFASQLRAACPPPENLTLATQADVDNFGTMYPNCTQISGNLTIGGGYVFKYF